MRTLQSPVQYFLTKLGQHYKVWAFPPPPPGDWTGTFHSLNHSSIQPEAQNQHTPAISELNMFLLEGNGHIEIGQEERLKMVAKIISPFVISSKFYFSHNLKYFCWRVPIAIQQVWKILYNIGISFSRIEHFIELSLHQNAKDEISKQNYLTFEYLLLICTAVIFNFICGVIWGWVFCDRYHKKQVLCWNQDSTSKLRWFVFSLIWRF